MKKINGVDSKVAVANSNANKTISTILSQTKESTKGLLKTSLGQKTEIYKKELFDGMEEKVVKSTRKKIRNIVLSLLSSLVEEKDSEKQKKIVSSFLDFYKDVYVLQDLSFNSIASENTKELKKDILVKGLDIVKKLK